MFFQQINKKNNSADICVSGFDKLTAMRQIVSILLIIGILSPTIVFGEFKIARTQNRQTYSTAQALTPDIVPSMAFDVPNSGFGISSFSPSKTFSSIGTVLGGFWEFFSGNKTAENNNNAFLSLPPGSVRFDFDGDGKADLGRWHSSNNELKIKNSSNGNFTSTTIGSSSSVISPGDFDGDGKTDAAVFNAGIWTIKKSSDSQTITVSFGTSGDKPVVGDYDGDGLADCAVFRPSTSTWWILKSSGGYTSTLFGASGDITAQGNFDGDSKTDIAVFRPSTGDWHVQGSQSGYFSLHWGVAADIPVPADYDGDGKTDFAIYRGVSGTWYVYYSDPNKPYSTQTWGNYGDQSVPADYDGDGKDDIAIWRPTNGVWHIIKSSNGNPAYDYQTLGQAGDTAVSSAYLKQIGGAVGGYDLAKVRLSPKNSTGGTDLYSRNFSWGASLVGLSGRAGMGAGFGISYNSLVWTKESESNAIYFDADNSNVSPGFRFGFPTIEPVYWDKNAERFNYLLVSPSGARVEFHQTGAGDTYETADSSYTQLKTTGAINPNDPVENITITLSGTDGSKMTYLWKAGAFHCSEIKDRNGNYISINHDGQGLLRTVTDTLGRVITVNYDNELYPTSITQNWKNNNGESGDFQYIWAAFNYTTATVNTNFASGINIVGPANGTTLRVLQKITFPSGGYTTFEYNDYAQIKKVNNYAADLHLLNYVKTDLDNPAANQTDCPRFSETRSWIENFNQNTQGIAQETVVTNSITENQTYNLPDGHSGTTTKIEVSMANHPHGALSKTFVGSSGWREGLPIASEDWANGTSGLERKRWTWTNWTQDDTNLTYIQNPRVIESKVGDTTNIKKSTTEYRTYTSTTIAEYGLVNAVYVYDADQTTILKKVETDYNLSSTYLSRRIIGLPIEIRAYGRESSGLNLVSKVGYQYDEGNFSDSSLEQNISSVIQHDNTNFGASFIAGRGNLTSTTRYDVSALTANATSSVKYNTAGAVVAQIDPLGKTVKINYGDSFNDTTTSRNTYAYPTKLTELANTDSANNFSLVKYRFDTGANVWAKSPKPAGNTTGKETTRLYDALGRLEKETLVNTGAYTRYEYPTNQIQSKVYSTVIDNNDNGADSNDEVFAESWTDGAGRVRRSRSEHPGSYGGYTGTLVEYDILGQVKRSSVPTEINSSYAPAGDDAARGWLWTSQEYDWKGRVTRTINTDGTDTLANYEGCGCAGGQVTTIQSELVPRDDQPTTNARRTQKVYEDILGRTYKTAVMNWDAATPYTTTVQTFNGRDQVTKTRQYAGTDTSPTYQDVTMTYDGHGRMKTRHYAVEDAQTETTWIYNADDSVQQVIDPRNAITAFTYNSRGLVDQISYDPPANQTLIPDVPNVNFTYDALGNRTQMTDGSGTQTYSYDQLSRLTSETKTFTGLTGNFTIGYTYQIGGGLKSITDPFSATVNYTNDKTGRLTAVNGSSYGGVTHYAEGIEYRAWGGIKKLDYKSADQEQIRLSYDNRLRVNHHEVATSQAPNGYLMKADYVYLADSRLQAKDDLLDDTWDTITTYDFAGRMNFNQFGTAVGTDNITKRVYEQGITYDAFSHMTARGTTYWGEGDGFTATYVNGRKVSTVGDPVAHDAAGNIVDRTTLPNEFQRWTFDAAGRQSKFTERHFTSPSPMHVLETVTEQISDGDGNPVIEKAGSRNVTMNPNSPTNTYVRSYKMRSSILKTELTKIFPDGAKAETKIIAGSAEIAKQTRYVDQQQQNVDEVKWISSDPVTGGTSWLSAPGQTRTVLRLEKEPLGQLIGSTDPAQSTVLPEGIEGFRMANDPEWQCSFPGDFAPKDCEISALIRVSLEGDKLWRIVDEKGNPEKVSTATDSPLPSFGGSSNGLSYASQELMSYALASSSKKKGGGGGGKTKGSGSDCPKGTVPVKDANGDTQCVGAGVSEVTIKDDKIPETISVPEIISADDAMKSTMVFGKTIFEINDLAVIHDRKHNGESLGEDLHCLDDEKLKKNLGEFERKLTDNISNRNLPSDERNEELVFLVQMINGKIVVGDIVHSKTPHHFDLGPYDPSTILAVFHTHANQLKPSDGDIKIASIGTNNWLSYVYGQSGLTLFNPRNPTTKKDKVRTINAAKCPPK